MSKKIQPLFGILWPGDPGVDAAGDLIDVVPDVMDLCAEVFDLLRRAGLDLRTLDQAA